MKIFSKSYIHYTIFLIIVGCIPFFWLKGEYIINGGDINFSLNPIKEFRDRLFAWNPYYNGGLDNCINFGSLPFCIIKVFFYSITHSIIWTEKLVFVFWYLLIGISIFVLTKELFPRQWIIARISAIIFYSINLYQYAIWRSINITAIVSLATIPIMMAVLIKIIKSKKKKYILFYGLITLLWGITSINPPVFILTFLLTASFIIYLIAKTPPSPFPLPRDTHSERVRMRGTLKRKSLSNIIILLLVILVINSYSLVPLLHKYITAQESKELITDNYNAVRYLATQSKCSSFVNVIRLMGNSEFYFDWKGDPYYPSFKHFLRKRNQFLGFLLPFLALVGVLVYKRELYVKFFFFITLTGVMFSMGIHWPMEEIYLWLFEHVPLFWLYRSPWLKFSILTILGYAILAGFGCQSLYNRFNRYKIGLLLTLSIWFSYIYFINPFISGKMFAETKDHIFLKPTKIIIPQYIYDFSNWVNKQEDDFNILLLPDEKLSIYKWGYMGITDISEMLLDKSIVHKEYGERGMNTDMKLLYEDIINKLYTGTKEDLEDLLATTRIKYICQRNDFQYDFYGDIDSPEFIKDILKKQNSIKFLRSFGKWDIYKVQKGPAPLIEIIDTKKPNSKIMIDLYKKSHTHYEITMGGHNETSQSIIIIFRENFNTNWKAYIKTNSSNARLRLKNHYKWNNYANAWKMEGWDGKDLKISIFYFSQKMFYIGLTITCLTILLLFCFTLINS